MTEIEELRRKLDSTKHLTLRYRWEVLREVLDEILTRLESRENSDE